MELKRARPTKPGIPLAEPRKSLSRERILRVAVDMADSGGLATLSMRELGSRLGGEAMSLYNHVANKNDLLDGMVDLVVEEIELPEAYADWRQAMHRRAASAREAFARHPWASALMDSRPSSGPARLRYFDQVIGILRRAGFTVEMAARAFSLLDSYVYGFGRQGLNMATGGEDDSTERAKAFDSGMPEDAYPYLSEMVKDYALKSAYDEKADFEFGLGIILGGLQRMLGSADPAE
jgi:AcrR family transcriptional regulator